MAPLFKQAITKESVLAEIAKGEIKNASKKLFEFMEQKNKAEEKMAVVEAFCKKYPEKALDYLYEYAFRKYALDFTDPKKIKEKEPHRIDEMKALAHGIAYFGFDGFRAISRLVYSSVDFSQDFSGGKYPLLVSLAYMVCIELKRNNKVSEEMYKHAKEYILKADLKPASLLVFGTMLDFLGFGEKFKNDQEIPKEKKLR